MNEKFFVLVFLLVFSFITTPLIKPISSTNNGFKDAFMYKVIKGDSLWTIGMKFDKKNIEKFLVETKKLNNLVNSEIFEDQILIIP